jgi:hypothetical protein
MKLICTLLFFGFFSISSAKKLKSIQLKSKYIWQYTMTENEAMLIRDTSKSMFGEYISFSRNQFSEKRSAKCGNDIIYNKTGTYFLSSKHFILNYTGGRFSDNVGGETMQVYVKGPVYYDVKRISNDTVYLYRTKGTSTKKVARTK